MGQKINPIGMRIGITHDWNSRWYANKQDYATYLHQDIEIRKYLTPKLKEAMLSHIEIERIKGIITVSVFVARPGVVVGQDGANIKLLKKTLSKLVNVKDIEISVITVECPDQDASLIAQSIAKQLEERASFRTVQKKAIQRVMKAGGKGCKTLVSGRLAGADIARSEGYKEGVLSLHTLRNDIDYALAEAHTTFGRLGCKVWISRGEARTAPRRDYRPGSKRGE